MEIALGTLERRMEKFHLDMESAARRKSTLQSFNLQRSMNFFFFVKLTTTTTITQYKFHPRRRRCSQPYPWLIQTNREVYDCGRIRKGWTSTNINHPKYFTRLLSATKASIFCWFNSSGRNFSESSIFPDLKEKDKSTYTMIIKRLNLIGIRQEAPQKNQHSRKIRKEESRVNI